MGRPVDVFEFLEELRKNNGRQVQNFNELDRYLDYKAREKRVPIYGQFELTPLCNFNCKMCYVHLDSEQLKGREVLPVNIWKNLMYQAWKAGMVQATLTGGECLIYPEFEELFLYLHSLGCSVAVLTNGYLLDDNRIQFFLDHTPRVIQVTLYGQNDDVYERVTGRRAFSVVADNVGRAIEAGLPVSLNVTPNSYLGEDVLDTIRFAKRLRPRIGVNSALFSPLEETGRSTQQDDPDVGLYIRIYQLINELDGRETQVVKGKLPPAGGPSHECMEHGLRCGGGRSSFAINWKGTMMACNRLHMIQADALKEGVERAWKKVCEEANSWPRVPECEGCPYYYACNNCMANILRFAEPGRQPTKLCEQTRCFVSCGVRNMPDCE